MARSTQQKKILERVLHGADRPLTIQEIWECARVYSVRISLATIYRQIQIGRVEGWIRALEIPGNGKASRFELSTATHRHYFVCRGCETWVPLDRCPVDQLLPQGCALESHEMVLYGRCPSCAPRFVPLSSSR